MTDLDRRKQETYLRLLLWTRQAERLGERLRHPDWDDLVGPQDEQDAIRDFDADQHFALVALSNLWRAIELASEVTHDSQFEALLKRFSADLPTQKDARDLHEHLNDYILGRGWNRQLQEGFDALATGTRPGTSFTAHIPAPGQPIAGPVGELRIHIAPDSEIELLASLKLAHEIGLKALAIMETHW